MTHLNFSKVDIDFPIFNANGRSLTSRLLQTATGGKLDKDPTGVVNVQALRDVSFNLQTGDKVGVIGHNGAGKSTILRTMSGVYFPTRGDVEVEGHIASLINLNLGLNPEATGFENVVTRGRLLGLTRSEILEKADEILEFSELGDFANMPIRTYSSGMLLRLAFSVSTIVKPQILLMDEWLSVGDEGFRDKAESRLQTLIKSTDILVIASHSRELLENVCNRVLWFEHGLLKADGDPAEILPLYFSGR